MNHPLLQAEKWMQMGKDVAIGTVIRDCPSLPYGIGEQVVIDDSGEIFWSISDVVSVRNIEQKIILESKIVITTGEPKMLYFIKDNGGDDDRDGIVNISVDGLELSENRYLQIYLERLG